MRHTCFLARAAVYFYAFLHSCIYANRKGIIGPSCPPFRLSACLFSKLRTVLNQIGEVVPYNPNTPPFWVFENTPPSPCLSINIAVFTDLGSWARFYLRLPIFYLPIRILKMNLLCFFVFVDSITDTKHRCILQVSFDYNTKITFVVHFCIFHTCR